MPKKYNSKKKQPENSGARKPGRRIFTFRPSTGVISITFLIAFIILAGVFYALSREDGQPEEPAQAGSFLDNRRALNQQLRDTLKAVGIKPERRQVIESKDKMADESYSWDILNWKVIVRPGFDFDYARGSLELAVHEAGGRPESIRNGSNDPIPLKIEAYLDERLSHRIFFTVSSDHQGSDRYPRLITSHDRNQRLPAESRRLDSALQEVLHSSQLQKIPMLVYEYWERQESGPVYPVWVVNTEVDYDLIALAGRFRESVDIEGFRLEENFDYDSPVKHAIDCYLFDRLSHRILLTPFPVGKGLDISRSSATDSLFISPPRVAIIIDDIGIDTAIADRIMELGAPVTLSILPHRPYSQEIAIRAFRRDHEFLLHLPMEPLNPDISPGIGGIYADQNPETVATITEENIEAVPNIAGINNHMGSKATQSKQTVKTVLERIRSHGLFFIDSRTTPGTLAFNMARELGIPTAERQVFLDTASGPDYDFAVKQLKLLIQKAKLQGSCVAIGHPFDETIAAIEDMIPEFRRHGVQLVFASQIVTIF